MHNFQRIGRKLYLAFAVLIVLEMITITIDYRQFQAIKVLSSRVAQNQWPKTVIANKIIDNVNANAKSVLALMFLSNPEEMKKTVAQMTEATKGLTSLYEELGKAVTEEREKILLANINSARSAYVGNRKKAIELALAGNTAQAKDMLVNETIPLQKAYLQTIYELIEMQGSAMTGGVANIESIVSSSITITLMLGVLSVVIAIGLVILITRSITRPLSHAVEIGKFIAAGKLDNNIDILSGGETGELLSTMRFMQEKLNNILSEVDDCSRQMGQSAFQVATISSEISNVSKVQENRATEVVGAMQQLHQISSTVHELAIEASERARQIEKMALEGIVNVQHNIESMAEASTQVSRASIEIQELEQSAQHINSIVQSIKEIAEQTNLLALNAAIEAARAGEQGRGFAVVADEVRKLAERTTKSAVEVGNIVGELSGKVLQVAGSMDAIVHKVSATQDKAKQTALTIDNMANNTVEAAHANQKISTVSEEQMGHFGLLVSTLDTLFSIMKESGNKVEITATIGDDLHQGTDKLHKIMADFTFNNEFVIAPIQHEKRLAPRAENSLRVKVTQAGEILEGLSQDISTKGLRLRLHKPVKDQEPVELSIMLPSTSLEQYKNQMPLSVRGKISWLRREGEGYLCGINFNELNDGQRNMIKKCFEFLRLNSEF